MVRRRIAAVIATAATAALVAIPLASPASAVPSGKLTVWATQTQQERLDLGGTGLTVGDVITGSGTVALSKGGKDVGTFVYRGETVRVNMPGGLSNNLSTVAYTLPGGTLLLQGLTSVPQGTPPTKPQPTAIIGGTGDYAGAQGTALRTPGDKTWKITFTFVR